MSMTQQRTIVTRWLVVTGALLAACGPAEQPPQDEGGESSAGSGESGETGTTTTGSTGAETATGSGTGASSGSEDTGETEDSGDTEAGCRPPPDTIGLVCFESSGPALLVGGERPVDVTVADLDADGNGDLVTADFLTRNLSVLRGAGGGAFWPSQVLKTDDVGDQFIDPTSVIAADFDDDGALDLATGIFSILEAKGVQLHLGDGQMTFERLPTAETTQPVMALAAGDLDDDGVLDVVATGDTTGGNVLIGVGDGSFAPAAIIAIDGGNPHDLALADLDGDAVLDTMWANSTGVHAALGQGDGSFVVGASYPSAGSGARLEVFDLDADGDVDLVVSDAEAGTIAVRLNDGAGTFSEPTVIGPLLSPLAATGNDLEHGDLDGDGALDLVFGRGDPTDESMVVLLGDGAGGFAAPVAIPTGSGPVALTLADLDGEGHLDLVAANVHENSVTVALWDPCACQAPM